MIQVSLKLLPIIFFVTVAFGHGAVPEDTEVKLIDHSNEALTGSQTDVQQIYWAYSDPLIGQLTGVCVI